MTILSYNGCIVHRFKVVCVDYIGNIQETVGKPQPISCRFIFKVINLSGQ